MSGHGEIPTTGTFSLTIDGKEVTVPAGTTVFDAARMNGIVIPTLCHQQNETPVGVCRLCVVEVGGRAMSAACIRPAEPGLKVVTHSENIDTARKVIIELLMTDHKAPCVREQNSGDCEVEMWARTFHVEHPRLSHALRNAARMIRRSVSSWITRPASSVTAAFELALRFVTIM